MEYLASVTEARWSSEQSGESSVRTMPSVLNWKTARSVIRRLTLEHPVKGRVQDLRIFGDFFEVCSMQTISFVGDEARSIAPPIPLTSLPGTTQLAKSPF